MNQILLAVLVVSTFAGIGAYQVFQSSAASTYIYSVGSSAENGKGCRLAGRAFVNNECQPKCRINGTKFIPYDSAKKRPAYCQGHVSLNIDEKKCITELHRIYLNNLGCARKVDQENKNDVKLYCQPDYPNYLAQGNTDRCLADQLIPQNDPTGDSRGGNEQPATDQISKEQCELLGRTWNTAQNACNRSCVKDAGALLRDSVTSIIFCQKAVEKAGEGTAVGCAKLNRKWIEVGCARRVDQKDTNNALQCLPDFPYYNANFKSATRNSNTDICEKDKQTAQQNETNDIFAGQPAKEPDTPTNPEDPIDENSSEFKITVYKDKNFKGQSLVIQSAQPKLPKGWNDTISSFKIEGGRWQLCEDANYQKNCTKRWASNPDLSSGQSALNDKISSLRPVTKTTFVDAPEDVIPICSNENDEQVTPTAENTCPEGSALTCPTGFELKQGDCKEEVVSPQAVVPVDKTFEGAEGREKCELLGREWIAPVKGKTLNGGEYGCSQRSCRLKQDGAPRQFKDGPVCISNKYNIAYAQKLDENECNSLHRIWIAQVKRCAQVPNQKDKDQTVLNAKQCEKKYSTYFIYQSKERNDECFKPSFFNKVSSVVKSTGGALGKALQLGPKAYCDTFKKTNYHWTNGACIPDRKSSTGKHSSTKDDRTFDIVSYNLKFDVPAQDGIEDLRKLISRDDSDIITLQEMSNGNRREAIRKAFVDCTACEWRAFMPNTRDQNENPILWNGTKFKLLDSGGVQATNRQRVDGRDFRALYVNYVKLEVRATGNKILVLNNHLPAHVEASGRPRSGSADRMVLYKKNMEAIEQMIRQNQSSDTTVFVTGDFNVHFTADKKAKSPDFPYKTLSTLNTFASYEYLGEPKGGTHAGGRLIDYVFMPRNSTANMRSQVIISDGLHSDHKALSVRIRL